MSGEMYTLVRIHCPPGCAEKDEFKVFGSAPFHWKSSICRAALFLGLYDDAVGGEIYHQLSPTSFLYKGETKNNIETFNSIANPFKDYSIVLSKINTECPKVESEPEDNVDDEDGAKAPKGDPKPPPAPKSDPPESDPEPKEDPESKGSCGFL